MNLNQKLSHLLKSDVVMNAYPVLWVDSRTYNVGLQVMLRTCYFGYNPQQYPMLDFYIKGEPSTAVLTPEGFQFISHNYCESNEMVVESESTFIPYSTDASGLFQYSLVADMKWLTVRYIKKLERIYHAYKEKPVG